MLPPSFAIAAELTLIARPAQRSIGLRWRFQRGLEKGPGEKHGSISDFACVPQPMIKDERPASGF